MDIETLIHDVIEPEAIAHKIRYSKKYNLKEDVFFYSNLVNCLKDHASTLNPHLHIPKEIKTIKNTYDAIKEFKEELKKTNGELDYNDTFKPVGESKIQFLRDIQAAVNDQWVLNYTGTESNVWSERQQKRVFKTSVIYQLKNKVDGTLFDFDLPDGDHLHFHMFWVPIERQNQGVGKRDFLYLCDLFFKLGINCMYSPCLTCNQPNRPVLEPDWRLNHSHKTKCGISVNVLGAWYERLGGAFLGMPQMNPQNIYFFSPSFLISRKDHWSDDMPYNPYERIERGGIYPDHLADDLKYISKEK